MDMAKGNNETLTAEQEMQLRQPIDDYVGEIQKKSTVSERTAQTG